MILRIKVVVSVARGSGSMTQNTAKAPPTGTRTLLRSSIGHRLRMLPNREKLSVARLTKAGRTQVGAVGIAQVLVLRIEEALSAEEGTALSEEASGAVT